ncbi:8364_t:CDS:2, partial [Gigaspora rosea]
KCQAADTGCTICKPLQSNPDTFSKLQPFPDPISKTNKDRYMSFNKIYGKDTSEKYWPSTIQKVNTSTISSTANDLVRYVECNWPRVLYSQYRLNPEEENLLKNFIETIDYTCGTTFYGISDLSEPSSAPFLNDNNCGISDLSEPRSAPFLNDNNCNVTKNGKESPKEQNTNSGASLKLLFRRVFVNAKLTCSTPMKVPYFSSHLYPDICFQCGDAEILSPTPAGEQQYCSEYH